MPNVDTTLPPQQRDRLILETKNWRAENNWAKSVWLHNKSDPGTVYVYVLTKAITVSMRQSAAMLSMALKCAVNLECVVEVIDYEPEDSTKI